MMSRNTVGSQAVDGLRLAGGWLLGMGWLALVFAGMAVVSTPSPHPPALGWALLGIAATVLLLTMDKCVRVFPGLLPYGALGSTLILVNGPAANHPEVMDPWLEAVALILFFTTATALSFTFAKHKLTLPDRIALFVFVVCFFWQAVVPRLILSALGIGFSCLVAAWVYDHTRRKHSRIVHSHTSANPSA